MQKISKKHFWIRQLRRPICALVVLCIVFFYCITTYAAEEDTFSFKEKYFPNDTVQYMSTIGMFNQYGLEHDNSKLSVYRNTSSFFNLNDVWQLLGSDLFNGLINQSRYDDFINWATSLNIPTIYSNNGVDYPLTNSYIIMSSNGFYGNNYYCIIPQGYCCLVDGYVVSESPFIVYTSIRENNTNIYNINQMSDNGLYCFTPHLTGDSYIDTFFFTDLDMFFKSSDSASGYSSFSLNSVGDFNVSDARSNYYNFNYLKTGGVIVAPSDPQPENIFGSADSYHYLNFNVANAYVSTGFSKFYHSMRFQWNEEMIKHPDWYAIDTEAVFAYKDDSMSSAVQFTFNDSGWLSLQDLGIYQGTGGTAPDVACNYYPIDGFKDSNNVSLGTYVKNTISRVTGTSSQYVDTSSFLVQVVNQAANAAIDLTNNALGTQLPRDLVGTGYYETTNEYNGIVEVCKITCYVRVGRIVNPDTMEIDYYSADNISSYDFVSGNMSIDSSENNVNLYPPVDGSGLPSSVISDGNNGYGGVSYGGSNNAYAQGGMGGQGGTVIINEPFTPYKLDVDVYGSMADVINTIKDDFMSNSQNGFYPVIQQTASFIRPEIWHVIFTGISVITLCSIVAFVRNRR